ncbi:hypothetical protein H2199_007783 [Coniosporium tulheliwenetii]|uniref:Uncharacterized protein n=1 Tax=Coniosporium tulheliwenetii TaxID=3383036 RepID=A0ACC2YN43_9PEZI|nr:hypothetical protein H2199_007783 [Cladosporium sp. JES 115]
MDNELRSAYRRFPSARAPLVHPTWERDGQWRIVLEIPLEVRKETNLPRRWKLRTPFKENSPEPSAHNIKAEETSVQGSPEDGLPSDYESDFDASMESGSDTEDDIDEEDVIEVDEYFDAEDDVDVPESAEVIIITDSEASDDSDDCFEVVGSELLPCDASETLTSGL